MKIIRLLSVSENFQFLDVKYLKRRVFCNVSANQASSKNEFTFQKQLIAHKGTISLFYIISLSKREEMALWTWPFVTEVRLNIFFILVTLNFVVYSFSSQYMLQKR